MKTFESKWDGNDGIMFFVQGWEPDTDPKALIALVHGLGEHTGRYAHVGKVMTDAGYAMVGFDLRGHGKSGGARGHFPSLRTVMQDIKEFLVFLAQRYPELPQFLYGHSLGGLLVLTFALKDNAGVKGVIATGPGLRSPIHDQKLKVAMAKLLGSLVPSIQLSSDLEVTALSRDQNVVKAYVNDPLVHDRMSLGFGKAGLDATDQVFNHAAEFPVPLLIMHSKIDKITYSSGSEDFARLVAEAGNDVTLKLWEGLYHELHNEPEKAEVFAFMAEWLDKHLEVSLSSHSTEN
ncbi:MAG: alpha/beta hydrolase [Anaerolineales bacterium]